VITNKNYEIACWGVAMPPDDWAYTQLDSFLRSTSGSNRAGYKSTAMDAAIDELKKAGSDAAKTTAFGKIAQIFFDDAVAVVTSHAEEYFAYAPRVQGVVASSFTTVNLAKVWVKK
jgi:ABC-type oligopeptide transport system substrate-binding subunit